MSPSTRRYKEAVKRGQQDAYSGKYNPPEHFDERQLRLYDKHYNETKNRCEQFDLDAEIMANAYGFTYVKDINGKFKLEKLNV